MGYEEEHEQELEQERLKARAVDNADAIPVTILESHDLEGLVRTRSIAIVNISPDKDGAILKIYEESLKIRDVAITRTITNLDDLKKATDDISLLTKLKKAIEDKRKEYVSPIRQNLDKVNDSFKTFMGPLDEADKVTREKIKTFNIEQESIRQAQEKANRLAEEASRKEAETHGGEITQPTEVVQVQPEIKKVSTNLGTSSMMKVRKWRLVDIVKVPPELLLVDAGKVTKLVKAGIGSIAGIEIYEEQSIRINTR